MAHSPGRDYRMCLNQNDWNSGLSFVDDKKSKKTEFWGYVRHTKGNIQFNI